MKPFRTSVYSLVTVAVCLFVGCSDKDSKSAPSPAPAKGDQPHPGNNNTGSGGGGLISFSELDMGGITNDLVSFQSVQGGRQILFSCMWDLNSALNFAMPYFIITPGSKLILEQPFASSRRGLTCATRYSQNPFSLPDNSNSNYVLKKMSVGQIAENISFVTVIDNKQENVTFSIGCNQDSQSTVNADINLVRGSRLAVTRTQDRSSPVPPTIVLCE